MNKKRNSKPEGFLNRYEQAYEQTPYPNGPPKDILDSVMAEKSAKTIKFKQRKFIMNRIIKIAAAIIIIAVVAIGYVIFTGGNGTAAIAWADVQEQLQTFRPYAYVLTFEISGKNPSSYRIMALSRTRKRVIHPQGHIGIHDFSREPNRMLVLYPEQKVAVEKTLTNVGTRKGPDILAMAKSLKKRAEELGEQKIDGRMTKGFRVVQDKFNDWTIWADIKTGIPVKIEILQQDRKVLLSKMKFDVDFDKSLFDLTVPGGYTLRKVQRDGSKPTEKDLIEGLRVLATFMEGRFPDEFEWNELQKVLNEYVEKNKLSPSDEELEVLGKKYSRASKYIGTLKYFGKIHDFNYSGKGVKLGNATTPIMWWLPHDSKKYRVVYGDLSIRDVEEADLPKIPNSGE